MSPSSSSPFSHLDEEGRARMVDVGAKAVTARTATAEGVFQSTADVVARIAADSLAKADVLATARLAGIAAAKRTSELIPLCHHIPLDSVTITFDLDTKSGQVRVSAIAKTTGKTGVEMEALTAVAVAGLTLHDMVKAADPRASMGGVQLVAKSGGKRGRWTRDSADLATWESSAEREAVVIVSSTTAAQGEREDATGPVIEDWLAARSFTPVERVVVADAQIADAVAEQVRRQPAVLITTGGTGVSADDRTPEATAPHITVNLPGVAEAMRARGLHSTPTAALSRGLAGFCGRTLVVNLPGSAGGVTDGLAVLDDVLEHLLAVHTSGGGH